MDECIVRLIKRLEHLGYRSFHLKAIFREAIGIDNLKNVNHLQRLRVIETLEKYEQLGVTFLNVYSK